MIKIIHITDNLNTGGLENTLKQIVLGLDRKKFSVKVICLMGGGEIAEEIKKKKIPLEILNISGALGLTPVLKLCRKLKKEKADIIHCHGISAGVWGRVAGRLAGIPVRFVHAQNVYYGLGAWGRFKERLLIKITTKVIAVSEAVKRSLTDFVGVDPKKIEVIYNSSPAYKKTGRAEIKKFKKRLGINTNSTVIGTISRLVDHKGHKFVIEAVAELKNEFDVKYLIIGEGPERRKLEQVTEMLGLKKNIIFTGLRKDVDKLLSIMDVFILPSTVREGLPLALAEAASLGLPLIATPIGGNREIVRNNYNGLIIPVENTKSIVKAVKRIVLNPKIRKAMSEKSVRIFGEKFTADGMIKKIEALYKKEFE